MSKKSLYILIAFSLFFAGISFTQANLISYESNVCSQEVFQNKLICVNDRIDEEAIIDLPFANPACFYSSTVQNYSSCPSDDRKAYYRLELSCLNAPTSVAISKVDDFCWSVLYLDTGNFIFNINIVVQHGRKVSGAFCADTLYYTDCGFDRLWKQIGVKVSASGCETLTNDPCDFFVNGHFEDNTGCPDKNSLYPDHINLLANWDYFRSVGIPKYYNVCGSHLGQNTKGLSSNSLYNIPPQPLPSGDGYIKFDGQGGIAQFVNLCQDQKYKLVFEAVKTNATVGDFRLLGGNTTSHPTSNTYDLLCSVPSSTLNYYQIWSLFEKNFWTSNSYNSLGVEFNMGNIDNIQLYPMDTVIYNTQLIGSRCDSADAVLTIPGCYGPYDLDLEINGDTLNFEQLSDGFTIRIPISLNTVIKTLSITNSLGCVTLLNTKDTIVVTNPGDASFESYDFCEGQTNTINFLADTGLFSLVNNSTGSSIIINTGQIINPVQGETYIISHAVCLDTVYDTITALDASADFISSDICQGDSNKITINGSTGGIFSIVSSPNVATINPGTGILSNTLLDSVYVIQYKVGGTCPDSTIQTVEVLSKENPAFELTDFCLGASNQANITGSLGGVFSIENPFDSAYLDSLTGEIMNETGGVDYIIKYVTSGVCKDSSWDTVSVFQLPTASIISGGGDLCLNDSVPLNVQFTGSSPWNVTINKGNSVAVATAGITTSNYSAYVSDTGVYTVFSVSDANGCVNLGDSTFIKVTGDSVSFMANILSGCAPLVVQLIPNAAAYSGGDCLWQLGDGTLISSCDTITHTYTDPGDYTPMFEVSSPKCYLNYALSSGISVQNKPEAIFYHTPKNPSVFENILTISNTSNDNDSNSWFLNGNYIDSIVNPELVLPPVLGSNNLCLAIVNSFGCMDTACSRINVLDESLIYVPNAFIPNNDGLNDVFVPVVSNIESYKLEIYDRWGRLIFITDLVGKGWDGTYKGKDCQEDVYIYKITYRFKGNFDDQYLDGHFSLYR